MLLPLIIPDLEEWFWENKKSKKTGRMANYAVSFSATSDPVSYTHLDVYKRQGFGRTNIIIGADLYLLA